MIACPSCGSATHVLSTRDAHENTTKRVRACKECFKQFITFELISSHNIAEPAKRFKANAARLRDLARNLDEMALEGTLK